VVGTQSLPRGEAHGTEDEIAAITSRPHGHFSVRIARAMDTITCTE
jgi:hypothetical protein